MTDDRRPLAVDESYWTALGHNLTPRSRIRNSTTPKVDRGLDTWGGRIWRTRLGWRWQVDRHGITTLGEPGSSGGPRALIPRRTREAAFAAMVRKCQKMDAYGKRPGEVVAIAGRPGRHPQPRPRE